MTPGQFRARMEQVWAEAERDARRLKDSYVALDRLHRWYRALAVGERDMADAVLAEWLLSDVEAKRFDAVALIREFGIASAVGALEQLAQDLGSCSGPGAPFEREKVESLVEDLVGRGAGPPQS